MPLEAATGVAAGAGVGVAVGGGVGVAVGAGVGVAVGAGVEVATGVGVGTGVGLGSWMVTEVMTTGSMAEFAGGPLLGLAAIWSTTSMPDTTSPKMTYVRYCSRASRAASSRTMKNCDPCEFGWDVRAMATTPRPY